MAEQLDHDLAALLDFWFAAETKPLWFEGGPAFDQVCRERFARLAEVAAAGRLDRWQAIPAGCVALCLLLDQMPRNLYRGTPQAFATDSQARAVAKAAIAQGVDQALTKEQRLFLYLPFTHSESLADQEAGVALFKALDFEDALHYAEEHAAVIRRFGRFPHRNPILGRVSSAAELDYLQAAPNYGQAAAGDHQPSQAERSHQPVPSLQ